MSVVDKDVNNVGNVVELASPEQRAWEKRAGAFAEATRAAMPENMRTILVSFGVNDEGQRDGFYSIHRIPACGDNCKIDGVNTAHAINDYADAAATLNEQICQIIADELAEDGDDGNAAS